MAPDQKQPLSHDAWLAQVVEEPLEPALPIIDPHHHLWDHPNNRYLLDEIIRDTGTGHKVVGTVFVECLSRCIALTVPNRCRPAGETEFVNGIAAQSASGQYGETRVAAGTASFADLTLGSCSRGSVTSAYRRGPGALSRYPACRWFRPGPTGEKFAHQAHCRSLPIGQFSSGLCQVEGFKPELRGMAVPSADARGYRPCEGLSEYDDYSQSFRRTAWGLVLMKAGARKFSVNGRTTLRNWHNVPNV